jgi:kynurenine 3-monooxygenase
MKKEKIVISGAGLVGAFLAIMLRKKGHDVQVFEKRSDMRLYDENAGRSINLIATSRALNAFSKVGIVDEVMKITVPVTGRMMHSLAGELTYQPYGRDETECNYSVSRSLLNKLLMTEAEKVGAEIFFEQSLDGINPSQNSASFSKKDVSFDRFFGADGAGSITRAEILRLNPNASVCVDFIDSDYKELFMPALSNGNYPMEKKALHIWPRGDHMFMALPNLEGSFTMTAYLPKSGGNGFDKLETKEDVLAFFKKEYGDSVELMPGLEKEFFDNPQGRLGTVRMSHWCYQDKIALVGDAAHAIVPFFGQGMNCGMEDCSLLFDLIDQHEGDWSSIFKKYDKEQRPNGNAIADMALDNFIEMRERVGDETFLLKKKIENLIENEFPKEYRSRYGMVTYTLIPYAKAQEAGVIQNEILNLLAKDISSIDELDIDKAKVLIDQKFKVFVEINNLVLDRFTLP